MIATIEEALETLRKGKMLILVDDEDRENEGDLVACAESITPEQITFMAKKARGLICVALAPEICDNLGLEFMTQRNTAPFGTAFTISVDAKEGITTGISAEDRAHTIRMLVNPSARKSDFTSPGSVFPLRAREGGVLVRTGQTEGSVDLARLAGLRPGAVICEIMKDDGTMMRLPDLERMGEEYQIPVVTVADIIAYRLRHETFIREVANANLPTEFGPFRVRAFESTLDKRAHLALIMGDIKPNEPTLVRVHRANFPGDTFPFGKGVGRAEVETALSIISKEGRGVFLYLNREETGIDLLESLAKLSNEPDHSLENAVKMESRVTFREFGIGAQILRAIGAFRLRVITRSAKKFLGLCGFGITIEEFVPY